MDIVESTNVSQFHHFPSVFFDICCPSQSKQVFYDDFVKADTKSNEDLKLTYEEAPVPKIETIPCLQGDISEANKVEDVKEMFDDIEQLVGRIKETNVLSAKEEADVNKTVSMLRYQLFPKRRARKAALKKFNFLIFKNQYANDTKSCLKE
jgi:hypothetical protein